MSCRGICAHSPALCSLTGIYQRKHQNQQIHHRCPVLFMDESRFTLSTHDRGESVWRCCGERYGVCNIIQHDKFGSGSVMVWGGISLEGRTDLHVSTVPLLLLDTRMKSSEPLSDLTLVQWLWVPPGAGQ